MSRNQPVDAHSVVSGHPLPETSSSAFSRYRGKGTRIQPGFNVWDASRCDERDKWVSLWSSWPEREVFAHPNYVKLFADKPNRALCAAWVSDDACFLYPFIQRDITAEPFGLPGTSPSSDIITPYGYGGAFCWGAEATREATGSFWSSFSEWAERENVVCEFVRFSLFRDTLADYPGEQEEKLQNVVRGLDLDEEALWMDFDHKVRKNVKKARRSNIEIELDPAGKKLDDFMRIYAGTMDRRGANDIYYFPREFFEKIQEGLPGQFMYFHAVLEGKVISTELVLVSAESTYSFLGGTDSEYFDLRPNDLLKYEIMLWSKSRGKRRFVLGGGYQPDDGIFKYKLAFAPDGCMPYFVGRRVLQPECYHALIESRKSLAEAEAKDWRPKPEFFPAYRA